MAANDFPPEFDHSRESIIPDPFAELEDLDISPPKGVREVLSYLDEVLSGLDLDDQQIALGYIGTMVKAKIADLVTEVTDNK